MSLHFTHAKLIAVYLMAATVAVAEAHPHRDRANDIVVSASAVATALSGRNWQVQSSDIHFFAPVFSRSGAELQIEKVKRINTSEYLLRFRCKAVGDCVPFLVLLTTDSAPSGVELTLVPRTSQGSVAEGQPIVRQGEAAVMIITRPASQISIPVICLGNGRAGQQIRAVTSDRKRFYAATVIGKGLLQWQESESAQ